MPKNQTLLIDFDGVLAEYNGWKGEDIIGPPLPNARHAMYILAKEYKLTCFTARPTEPVMKWLAGHGFPHMKVTNTKDPAFLQIDDRALTFQGTWNDALLSRIRGFKPWWSTPADAVAGPPGAERSYPPASPASDPSSAQSQRADYES